MFPGKPSKTLDELAQNLRDAHQMLLNSFRLYDEGQFVEVARIASLVYTFTYDHGKKTRSILTLIGRKNVDFLDSAGPLNPKNLLTEMPMVRMRIGSQFEYLPKLSGYGPEIRIAWMPFSRWWEGAVLRDSKRREISRKNLVTAFRNTEGGGHVAPYFEEVFADLRRNNSMGWVFRKGDQERSPVGAPEYATMRQIGWELDQTLKRFCEDFLR